MFRFTIRDVLWLTTLVAMGLAWRLDHRAAWQVAQERLGAIQHVQRLRIKVDALKEQRAALIQNASPDEN